VKGSKGSILRVRNFLPERSVSARLSHSVCRVPPSTAIWRIARFGEGTSADLHDKSLSPLMLTTFSDTLANALQSKLRRLLAGEPRLAERIDVHSLNAIGKRLYKAHVGPAESDLVRDLLKKASADVGGHKFSMHFLMTEWAQVVDAWQLEEWESYRDVARLGRKTRIPEPQRKVLWSIFTRVRDGLKARKMITEAQLFTSLAGWLLVGRLSIRRRA